ncbi:MAG: sodium:proton antiporter [Rhodospirillales bacterium]|nr:sodium:proton antiporter [Rhodospirillales bacterium]
MQERLIFEVTAIGVLGMMAQWIAWRTRLPAIVLLSVAGILVGPVFGLLDPEADFGKALRPMIAIAVAIILFEGGLNLNFRELRETSIAVRRLIIAAVPIGWVLGTLAAHFVAGLSWPIAALFGGLLVVTGPTVILPLLRQARLAARPASVLKWEGIVNDPIGAMLAVLVFEFLLVRGTEDGVIRVGWLLAASAVGAALGFALGRAAVFIFAKGLVPEHLKTPALLVLVLAGYESANLLQAESGLFTVTVLGVTIANTRFANFEEIRRFKESLSIILVSAVFVLLTASLDRMTLVSMADWRSLAFVFAMLFVVRPATVWLSTIGSGLTWRERALVGWIAPRGVVAVAVSGFFAGPLIARGYPDAAKLVPLTFLIVFATVVAHGFSIRFLAQRLGLSATTRPGVLIVGGSPWSTALAVTLTDQSVPVMIVDTNWRRLRPARLANMPVHFGEILSEAASYHVELDRFSYLLAVTDNDAYNAFACIHLSPHFGKENVLQLGTREDDEHEMHGYAVSTRGRTLLGSGAGWDDLNQRCAAGWVFQKTKLTETYGWERYLEDRAEGTEPLLLLRGSGEIRFETQRQHPTARPGDVVVSFAPPDVRPRAVSKLATLPG